MGLYRRLKQLRRVELTIHLALMSVFSFGLSILRWQVTGTTSYLFLNFNLFLAFIPWAISSLVLLYPRLQHKLLLTFSFFVWVLFFPNAPYILTDLFHLRERINAPVWFDLALILSFAWTGLLFGFSSLVDIESLLSRYFRRSVVTGMIVVLLFSAGFGVYLGRFLRWNSWDVISAPDVLFLGITDRFINPFDHSRTWGLTIVIGILLNSMFFSVRHFKGRRPGTADQAIS
ncbi:DUF1361 domain-containing protein [Hufsiella ginkgonis]|uniref:DUF1361 domain-containing protein n=1 Tax=Hufsiella ginkgonis TaxID=2695274 RepID=A0A7K1Y3X2_9SPHI|nr:DUF1361 domain-containing protein [Hufsiella ginkgonis]MXV17951.1 DUF1361 domain-containing protein [Hufsiella ginkgonis]